MDQKIPLAPDETRAMQLESLRQALGALPDAILVADAGGRIVFANARAEELLGFTHEELLALTVEELLPERLRARHARHRRQFAAAPRPRPMGAAHELVALRADGSELEVDISLGPVSLDGQELVIAALRDARERRRAERDLRLIAEGLASTTGADFFRSLVRYLAAALGVRYALVGAVAGDCGCSIRTLAVWDGDGLAENFTYSLAGTPCDMVVGRAPCRYPAGVQELFPEDGHLRELDAESYLGLPLFGSRDQPLGLIAVLDDKPLPESDSGEAILRIFAARAAAELERLQADEARRDSDSRFRAIFDEAPVGIVIFDSEGRIAESNRSFRELTGYTSEELRELPRTAYTHPEDVPAHLELWNEMLAGERNRYELEKRYLRKDGTIAWGHVIASTVDLGSERLPFRFSIVQDITERRVAEHALREANERFELAALAAQAAVYDWDPDLDRGVLSRGFREHFGYSSEDVDATHAWWLDHVHPDDRERADQAFRESVRTGRDYVSEYRLRAKDGRYVDVVDRALALRDETGRVRRMVGAMLDVTDLKEIEARLRRSEKLEALGRLAGGIAHDFNNVLSVITGYGELLRSALGSGDPRQAEVAEILRAAESGEGLTRQLLAYSRDRQLRPEVLDLNTVVQDAAGMLRRLLGQDVELVCRLAPSPGRVSADPGQLEQVIVNLVTNARDAMPDGGRVTIETRDVVIGSGRNRAGLERGAYVLLAVSDTGAGIDEQTRARIFEPFFTTKGHRGTGLGLATVYRIVTESGGQISVESEPGQGTVFELYFPRVRETVAAGETVADEPLRRAASAG